MIGLAAHRKHGTRVARPFFHANAEMVALRRLWPCELYILARADAEQARACRVHIIGAHGRTWHQGWKSRRGRRRLTALHVGLSYVARLAHFVKQAHDLIREQTWT